MANSTVRLLEIVTFSLLITCNSLLLAQGETGVPFLLITSSAEGNGMGGISASLLTDNAMAPIGNPGQLGFISLSNFFSGGFYTTKTKWLLPFGQTDLDYNVTAFNLGLNLEKIIQTPIPVSLGIGYSRIFFNLGRFALGNPPRTILYDAHEKAENVSIAVGVDYIVRLGIGLTIKNIVSDLGPVPPDTIQVPATVSATDFGIVTQIPIIRIVSRLREEPLTIMNGAEPLLNITGSYSRSNVGPEIVYSYVLQGDPLPRKATLGLSLEVGLIAHPTSNDWKVFSFIWARETEDILVNRFSNGSFEYQQGLGDIQFFKNDILGEWNGKVFLRKGWQLGVGEMLYVRSGSVIGPGLAYRTTGFGLRLAGLFKLIQSIEGSGFGGVVIDFVADHIDVQYDQSSYGDTESPIAGTTFNALNVTIK